ncbi:MAG: phosphate ABC transporter ATP-binding protein [Deltaproteobacteria bacterium]|jgi:phosphate transport system ATP-binding protein|nr:phosphate ABC transporter ATP-binding protein [Deltaproteobacteria bacterium]
MPEKDKITLQNFSSFYGDSLALKEVSLRIRGNQIFAFLGPARSGKTTLLKSINRLTDLIFGARHTGQIFLDEQDIFAPEVVLPELRRRVGMVFDLPTPLPLSIFDNVAYGPRLKGIFQKSRLEGIVERALKSAVLWDEVKERLSSSALRLSGGQQQRLCIARVLALEPEIIMLDEPCSGLDPISTASIEESLTLLKKEYTILLVPHNIQQASRVADRVGFFLNGELIEQGAAEQIFTRPKDKRTEDYISGKFG